MNRYKNDKADETRMIRFIDPNYREPVAYTHLFLSQCERADEAGSVHTFGVELNRETFEQYKHCLLYTSTYKKVKINYYYHSKRPDC